MELIDRIILLVVIAQAIHWVYQQVRGMMQRGHHPTEDVPDAALSPHDPAQQEHVEDVTVHLEDARAEVVRLQDRCRAIDRDLAGSHGPVAVLRRTLEDPVLTELNDLGRAVEQALLELREADSVAAMAWVQRGELRGIFEALMTARQRIGLLQAAAVWRGDHQLGQVMADGDAMAAALLEPIVQFSRAHGVKFPDQRPVCVPTDRGREAVIYDLLPGHPVILVPPAFGEDMVRWASIAHEVGHVMWFGVPGFAADMHELAPTRDTPWLPRLQGRQLEFDLWAVWSRWLPELVADAFGALLLGPAALTGMIGAFAQPDDPEQVVRVDVAEDGRTVGSHPPAHVRVHLTAGLLHRMGFDQEVAPPLHEWDLLHGAPDRIFIPTLFGQTVALSVERIAQPGREILEELYTASFDSLGGYPVSAIHGLELTPGMWARVGKRVDDLVEGRPFQDDARLVLAAAVQAAAHGTISTRRLAEAVKRAVLGVESGERPMSDPAYAIQTRAFDAPITQRDVVEAIVLRTVLKRRGDHTPRV